MARTDNVRGVAIMLAAVGFLSLMDAGLKLLAPHYPPLQVGALRAASSLPLILVWIGATTGFRSLRRVRWPLHLLRGAIGVAMMAAFVYALRDLPLTTAYILFFVAPLMIVALSGPVLGEHVGPGRWVAIVVGFSGTWIVLRPTGEGVLSLSGLMVVAAAAGYAVSAITVRVLSRTDTTQAMVFWVLTSMALGSGLLAAPGWVPIQPGHGWIIAGIGATGALGQWAITEAFSRGEASVIAPIDYTALAWAMGFDLLLWGVIPDAPTFVGAAVIVAAGLYLMRNERRACESPVIEPTAQ
ncbi:MAG TPA: DMT family transporter [Nevskiaceae bacterium]|nr:DMT family transporter [Nevskiaceae bacterium]